MLASTKDKSHKLVKTIQERTSQTLTEAVDQTITNGNIKLYFEILLGHVHQRQLQSNGKYKTILASDGAIQKMLHGFNNCSLIMFAILKNNLAFSYPMERTMESQPNNVYN